MSKFGKIEYKPISIRELLVDIKDLSELMIDLAYAAALFNNKELAEEVKALEEHVDRLAYQLDMSAMVAARDGEDAESLLGVSIVATAADKISDAAGDIAAIVLKGIGIHPIAREVFEKVEENLTCVKVKGNSALTQRRLKELELAPRMGVDVIAIRREKQWIINPEESEVLQEGDVLFARGTAEGIEELEKLAKGEIKELSE
jgi:uncharacterized protein with PhoU and TrkA domain